MKIIILTVPLIIGFLLDFILGDPYNLPHPIRLIGNTVSSAEKLTRKLFHKNLKTGGVFMSLSVLILSTVIPLLILFAAYKINIALGIVTEGILCWYLIAAKSLKKESMKVYYAQKNHDTEKSRHAVSMIVGRDTSVLDDNGIIRAAVETVAENTSDGVTAPVMYMALGGAVGGFFYKAANTMDSMVGYKNEKYADIGFFSAKLDDFLNFIPSRITALLMIVSSFFLGFDAENAFRIWKRDRLKHASPNSAQTESVCAGALNIRLAGDAYYFGELHKKEFIGDAVREIENEDIKRINKIMYTASVLNFIISLIFRVLLWGVLFS